VPVVLDANLAVSLVIPTPYSAVAAAKISEWRRDGVELLVPALWEYELASALRKGVSAGVLPLQEAELGLEQVLALGVESAAPTLELHVAALRLAGDLGHFVSYDAAYLALAESVGAELWTADQRLARDAACCGLTFVRCL